MESRPKFRTDLIALKHTGVDNTNIIVLKDPVSEKFYRLSAYEYRFLGIFDGNFTLDEVVEQFRRAGYYISPEEGKLILGKAAQMGLMLGTKFGTAQFQRHLRERSEEAKRAKRFSSVYFLFIPLVNPDRFLERTLWFVKLFANRWTVALAALLTPGAIYLLIAGLDRIHTEYLFFFNLQNLLQLWITIALTKLAHEFAHAYTAKNFGLHVPRMGLAFLIFFPCLYCDTTDAWLLADRRQRIAISAAGIVAEGALAVVSAYVWYFTGPGMVNSLAFYLLAVSFISTVLFNGNPLMKFDGYFILIDVLGIPNLQGKSFAYIRYLFMNRVLGVSLVPNPARTTSEISLFGIYGVSSFIYRIFLYTGIVVGVYYRFDKTLGIVLALLAFALFVLRPIVKGVKAVYQKRSELSPRPVAMLAFLVVVAAVMAPLCIPWSSRSVFPCYVGSAQVQKLTVPLHTSVSRVYVKQGAHVAKGTVLFELDASLLHLALIKKELQRDILKRQVDLLLLDSKEMSKAGSKQIEVFQAEDEIQRIKKDLSLARGGIIAPFDGVITTLDYRLQPGFQPGEGVVVGELESPTDCVVRALIPEKDRHKVAVGQEIEIWLPLQNGVLLSGKIDSMRPYSEKDLKDSPFSSRLGGELATEPKGTHQKDVPLEAQYMCSVRFPEQGLSVPLGMTGRFAVPLPPQSILSRFVDKVYQTFARESMV